MRAVLDIQVNNSVDSLVQTVSTPRGKLFLVSVPIGNDADFSQRALNTLKLADIILCEEYKEAKRILRILGIEKPLIALNEHTEKNESEEIINILKSGKNIALISDHGTPLLEDPGKIVVKRAIAENITVTTVPGASSILSALILSGFDNKKFLYYGLLPPRTEERKKELIKIRNFEHTIIFLDTPYRLSGLLESLMQTMGKDREVSLAIDLTMESEKVIRGTISQVIEVVTKACIKKSEFVLVVKGKSGERNYGKQNHKSFRH